MFQHQLCLFFMQAPFNTVRYMLIGDDSTPSFFTVEPTNGLISMRVGTDLRTDTQTKYIVSHSACVYVTITELCIFPPMPLT